MTEQEPRSIGLVPTAGLEIKRPENCLIPDAEGRIRMEAAVIDLRSGLIDEIHLCGGAKVDGFELGEYYYFYLMNNLEKEGLDPDASRFLEGGYETGSDLDWALDEIDEDARLRIYSTTYHLARIRLILKSLGRDADLVKADRLVASNSSAGAIEVRNVLNDEFLKRMYAREELLNDFLGLLDHNPLLPRRFRLGSRILEDIAFRRSE